MYYAHGYICISAKVEITIWNQFSSVFYCTNVREGQETNSFLHQINSDGAVLRISKESFFCESNQIKFILIHSVRSDKIASQTRFAKRSLQNLVVVFFVELLSFAGSDHDCSREESLFYHMWKTSSEN